jgi:hypothetical protein
MVHDPLLREALHGHGAASQAASGPSMDKITKKTQHNSRLWSKNTPIYFLFGNVPFVLVYSYFCKTQYNH